MSKIDKIITERTLQDPTDDDNQPANIARPGTPRKSIELVARPNKQTVENIPDEHHQRRRQQEQKTKVHEKMDLKSTPQSLVDSVLAVLQNEACSKADSDSMDRKTMSGDRGKPLSDKEKKKIMSKPTRGAQQFAEGKSPFSRLPKNRSYNKKTVFDSPEFNARLKQLAQDAAKQHRDMAERRKKGEPLIANRVFKEQAELEEAKGAKRVTAGMKRNSEIRNKPHRNLHQRAEWLKQAQKHYGDQEKNVSKQLDPETNEIRSRKVMAVVKDAIRMRDNMKRPAEKKLGPHKGKWIPKSLSLYKAETGWHAMQNAIKGAKKDVSLEDAIRIAREKLKEYVDVDYLIQNGFSEQEINEMVKKVRLPNIAAGEKPLTRKEMNKAKRALTKSPARKAVVAKKAVSSVASSKQADGPKKVGFDLLLKNNALRAQYLNIKNKHGNEHAQRVSKAIADVDDIEKIRDILHNHNKLVHKASEGPYNPTSKYK